MLFIAMFFLVFALFLMARGLRGYQAIWLGLILFTFGCCIVGLVGLVPRFGNYRLEGFLDLPLDQPVWAWSILERLSLYDFMRFRLWNAVGFTVAVFGFAFVYTVEQRSWKDYFVIYLFLIFIFFWLWYYEPFHLFELYKEGTFMIAYPQARLNWEHKLIFTDKMMLLIIGISLSFAIFKIFRLFFYCTILQKRIQAVFVGVGNTILSMLFMIVFCFGRGSVLNAHTMATTLLPLGRGYPLFDNTYLRIIPFATFIAVIAVMLSIIRYGFLGTRRIGIKELEQQINVANQAVRMALHSFKNRFLGVQMAMEMASSCMELIKDEQVDKARIQIKWAQDVCREALVRLDVLHIQAQRLQVNPRWLNLKELIEAARKRCEKRLEGITFIYEYQDDVYVWGDREHLITVLENLLQNASDALTEKKTTGFVSRITIEIGREYEWSFIRISDNGTGISKENLHRIFRPFFTTKPTKNNWGLGLTYCHRVIKMHRGYINIRSQPGIGTTIEIILRCREKPDKNTNI